MLRLDYKHFQKEDCKTLLQAQGCLYWSHALITEEQIQDLPLEGFSCPESVVLLGIVNS